MNLFCTDSQSVGEVSSTLFSILPASNTPLLFMLQNVGANTLNFTAQGSNDGITWTNIDQQGGPSNNSLVSGQLASVPLNVAYSKLQFIGNASGGSILQFAVSAYVGRASGGSILILTQ